jgi:hypothetical protein
MDQAFTRIGATFDGLAARTRVRDSNYALRAELDNIVADYETVSQPGFRSPLPGKIAEDVHSLFSKRGAALTGEQYQQFRSDIDRAARGALTDPDRMHALQRMRGALDDAMERSMTPQDAAAWRDARRQYRNLLVVEDAAARAGAGPAMGLPSPAAVRQAVRAQNERQYVRGEGDFADLARAGAAILPEMPQSGTAPRSTTLVGAIRNAPGSAIVSRPITQGYLGNQIMRDTANSLETRASMAGQVPPLATDVAQERAQSAEPPTLPQYPVGNRSFDALIRRGVSPSEALEAIKSPRAMQDLLRRLGGQEENR